MMKYWTLAVFAVALAGCGCQNVAKNKTAVPTVENDIREHLPIGSSKADVTAYLDQRKIGHSWLKEGKVSPTGDVVIPNSHTEVALIPDVRKEGSIFKVFVSIEIDFKFDDSDSKLISYSVREVYKGP